MVTVVEQVRNEYAAPTTAPTETGSSASSGGNSGGDFEGSSDGGEFTDDTYDIPYSLNGGDVGGLSTTTALVISIAALFVLVLGCSVFNSYCVQRSPDASTGCDTPTEGGKRKLKIAGTKYAVPNKTQTKGRQTRGRLSESKKRRESREGAMRVRTTADSDDDDLNEGSTPSAVDNASFNRSFGSSVRERPSGAAASGYVVTTPPGVSLTRTGSTDNVLTSGSREAAPASAGVVQMGGLNAALQSTAASRIPTISGPPTPTGASAAMLMVGSASAPSGVPSSALSPAASATMSRLANSGETQHGETQHENKLLQLNLQQQDLLQQQISHRQRHLQHQLQVTQQQQQSLHRHRLPPIDLVQQQPWPASREEPA
jgi:hypothetical protein